jgi:hypothetical protein
MSLIPFSRSNSGAIEEGAENVLRIWLDEEQAGRLRGGKYFATIVRKEDCCWIRGNMSEDIVFLMDNKRPSEDKPGEAGSFYNTAPRFSVPGSRYVSCERKSPRFVLASREQAVTKKLSSPGSTGRSSTLRPSVPSSASLEYWVARSSRAATPVCVN